MYTADGEYQELCWARRLRRRSSRQPRLSILGRRECNGLEVLCPVYPKPTCFYQS